IDKLCAIAQHKNVEVAVVITKTDLLELKQVKEVYEKAGYPVFFTCEESSGDMEKLKKLMCGKLCAFAGNSGVGKSTLLNKLFCELSLETNAISQKLGRGKHTT
ncbi:MAG: GTPase RsgA, partial [Oscillospiraceae bacterium]